eukprot:g35760.t1
MHRICSDEEERDGHLKVLKDALIRTGYDAELIDRKCHSEKPLQRQTQDTTNRVLFAIQYFPRAEKLRHVLCSLQHVVDDNEHLAKIIPTPPKNHQTLNRPLPTANHPAFRATSTKSPYNLVMATSASQIIDMDTTITCGNTIYHVYGRYTCDSANVVYLIRCRPGCPEAWYIGETMQTLRQQMNRHCTTIARQECFLPVRDHFSGRGHSASDLRISVLQGGLWDTQQHRVTEQRLTAKFCIHEDNLKHDLGFKSCH